jgi:peptide-methionine (S)-S-oxide reductase
MSIFGTRPTQPVGREEALPGRATPIPVPERHRVLGTPLAAPYPDGSRIAEFALGCFWGAERKFWQTPGVISTSVGYAGGYTPNASYEEVCSGLTGHTEVVRVVYDPKLISYPELLKVFWESHDPTQGLRQGNDIGTQYRSAIFYRDEDERVAAADSAASFGKRLVAAGYGAITTEITPATDFYFAEGYHQQYLDKNPDGYCGLGGTGVTCLA